MNPDEWLNQNTGQCVRLAARITPAQCETNRKEHISCNGCEGLDMEKKFKGGHSKCSVAGCEKQAWKAGMCYKHFHHQQQEMNQNEPKVNQSEPKVNQESNQLPDLPPTIEEPSGLSGLLPVVEIEKPGYFLDFSDRRTEFNILEKNGVTPEQVVRMLCLVAGGGYELRKVRHD